jgi:hypothetical protein
MAHLILSPTFSALFVHACLLASRARAAILGEYKKLENSLRSLTVSNERG